MKLPWTTGNKPSPDDTLGSMVLALARENPTSEDSLRSSPELKGAVHAIIEALPTKARRHLTNDTKVDIAAVIILQRAAAYQEALLAYGLAEQPEEAQSEHATDTGTYPTGAEEA